MHRGNRRKYHPESRFNVSPRAMPQKSGPPPMGYDPRLTDPSRQVDPRAVPSRIAQGAGPSGKFAGQEYLDPYTADKKTREGLVGKPPLHRRWKGDYHPDESTLKQVWDYSESPEGMVVGAYLPIGALGQGAKLGVRGGIKGVKVGIGAAKRAKDIDIPFFGGGSKKLLENLPARTRYVFEERYVQGVEGRWLTVDDIRMAARGKHAEAISRTDIVEDSLPFEGIQGEKFFTLGDRNLPGDMAILEAGEKRLMEVYRVWRGNKDTTLLKTLFERNVNVTEVPKSMTDFIDPSFGHFPETLQRALLKFADKDMDSKIRLTWMKWVGTLHQGRRDVLRDALGKYGKAHPRFLKLFRKVLREEYGDEILVFRVSSTFPGGMGGLGGLTTPTGNYTSVTPDFNHAAMFLKHIPKHLQGNFEMAKIPINKVFAFGGIDESELIIAADFGQKIKWMPLAAPIGLGLEDVDDRVRGIDADG